MQIFIASDHAGFELKNVLVQFLKGQGHQVEDMGPSTYIESDDYPDYIMPMAQKVAQNKGSFGIAIGGSGQGEAMAANRVAGIRAAVYYGSKPDMLKLSRQHNDANVLALSARFLTADEAVAAVLEWLSTPFSNDARHIRRIEKLDL